MMLWSVSTIQMGSARVRSGAIPAAIPTAAPGHMAGYVRTVARLSKDKLGSEAVRLAGVEKAHMAQLIAHIAEISRRNLYLEWGHCNLFAYCVNELGLSEGSVWLRMQVAGVCRRFPALLDSLAANRISLTVAGRLAPGLTDDNWQQVISDCEGMTQKQVMEYAVRWRPKPKVSSGIRKAPKARTDGVPATEPVCELFGDGGDDVHDVVAASDAVNSAEAGQRASIEPASLNVFNVRFAATGVLKEKIERLAEVLGVSDVARDLERVFEIAVDLALEKKDPQKKLERRQRREAAKANKQRQCQQEEEPEQDVSDGVVKTRAHKFSPGSEAAKPASETEPGTVPADRAARRSRYIPSEVRERRLAAAGHRCEFVSAQGRRCEQRTGLAIDHVVPFGRGGSNDEGNLRCLCRAHNQWTAEQEYGAEFMRAKVEARR